MLVAIVCWFSVTRVVTCRRVQGLRVCGPGRWRPDVGSGPRAGRAAAFQRKRLREWFSVWVVSAERGDAAVGGEGRFGCWPTVEDPHDVAAAAADNAGRGVPYRPAELFRFVLGGRAVTAEELEPAGQVGGPAHDGEAGGVGVPVGEGEPLQAAVAEAADAVLDGPSQRRCSMSAHDPPPPASSNIACTNTEGISADTHPPATPTP